MVEENKSTSQNENNEKSLEIPDDEFFMAIGHEIRRKIIKTIGDNGFAGFVQLKKASQARRGYISPSCQLNKASIIRNRVYLRMPAHQFRDGYKP